MLFRKCKTDRTHLNYQSRGIICALRTTGLRCYLFHTYKGFFIMIIGIPREVKIDENRVSLPPAAVGQLVLHGHTVLVEANAGAGSAFADAEYVKAGGQILESAADVWNK